MRKSNFLHILLGAAFALGLVLLLVLGAAALIWSGTLPASTPSLALSFCMGLCAFAGGRFAIGKGSGNPIITGIITGGVLTGIIALICLCLSGNIPLHGRFLATILLTLAGGCLSGLFGRKKKRKKNKKK